MNKKKLILIGAGGHASSCIDVINSSSKYYVLSLVDKKITLKKKLYFKKYNLISEKDFTKKKLKNLNIHISIGQLKDGYEREKLYNFFKSKGCYFPIIKSTYSVISKSALIGEGSIVMHFSIINSNARVGKNCIINSRATIEHDCIIGDNVHIAPGAIVLGGSCVKKNTFIGSGAIIRQNSIINENSIIKAGSYFNK